MPLRLENYFRTTRHEGKSLDRLPAKKETKYQTTATSLLDIRREMAEVEQALIIQKDEYRVKLEGLKLRKDELERKEFLLRKNVEKFESFIQENDSKRARAMKNILEERLLKQRKQEDIDRLLEEKEEMIKYRNQLNSQLEFLRSYYEFMSMVLETTDEYREGREVLARYQTLLAIHVELMQRQQSNFDALEKLRNEHQQFLEAHGEQTVSCNLQLAELQTRMEAAGSSVVKNQAKWNEVRSAVTKRTILLGMQTMAIDGLYDLLLEFYEHKDRHLDDDYKAPTNAIGKLEELKQFILDLTYVSIRARRPAPPADS